MNKPKKWIADKIESLDPYKDYIEIWRLSSSYRLNDLAVSSSKRNAIEGCSVQRPIS